MEEQTEAPQTTEELDPQALDDFLAQQQTKARKPRSDAGKPRGPRGSNKSKQNVLSQSDLHLSVVALIGALSLFVAEEYRIQRYEIDMIFEPLERIILRRALISDKFNPDVVDGLQALIGLCIYASRIYHVSQSRKPIPHGIPAGLPQGTNNQQAKTVNDPIQFPNAENILADIHRNLSASAAQ